MFWQWRGNYFWTGRQDRERQSREREIKVYYAGVGVCLLVSSRPEMRRSKKRSTPGLGASSCPEMKRSQKKGLSGFGRNSVPKMAQNTSLRGGKSRPGGGGAKYLQEGSCPPSSPTSRAYVFWF